MLQVRTLRQQRNPFACHCVQQSATNSTARACPSLRPQPQLPRRRLPHGTQHALPHTHPPPALRPAPGHGQRRPHRSTIATHAAYAAAAASSAAPYLPALLTSVAWLVLALAVAVFLVACIPLVASAAHSAARMAAILKIVEQELPETIATARVSGLEVTDCVRELSELGSDLSGGIQATARMITTTEATLTGGKALVERAVRAQLLPAAAAKEREAHELLAAQLRVRAKLAHDREIASQAAAAARALAARARAARVGGRLAGAALQAGRLLRAVANHAASRNLAGLAGDGAAQAQRAAPGA